VAGGPAQETDRREQGSGAQSKGARHEYESTRPGGSLALVALRSSPSRRKVTLIDAYAAWKAPRRGCTSWTSRLFICHARNHDRARGASCCCTGKRSIAWCESTREGYTLIPLSPLRKARRVRWNWRWCMASSNTTAREDVKKREASAKWIAPCHADEARQHRVTRSS